VPALITEAGEQAGWRYAEFFGANIQNPHTRRAYARACGRFFAWCEDRGLTLTTIRPSDVAAHIEKLQQSHSAPGPTVNFAARPYGLLPRCPDRGSVEHDLVVGAAGRRCEHQLAAMRAGDRLSA
jgi:hypothetical protein